MPPTPKTAAAGAGIALLLAFTVFRPPSTPGPLERDFEAYYASGATVNAGGDPYSRAIWSAERRIPGVDAGRDEVLPYVGPAAALPFWSLLARLPYGAALAVWTMVLVGALAALLLAALRLTRTPRDPWTYGLAGILAFASAPAIAAVALGQAALVSAAGIACALVAYRSRWPAGAFGGTLLAAVQPNLALALLARLRSRWDVALAASAAAAFAIITLLAGGGRRGFVSYLHRLGAHGAAERDVTIQHTPAAIAYSFGLSPETATLVGTAVAIIAAATAIAVIVRERLDATTATLVTCALLPLVLPFFHEHDLVIEVLPIVVLALRTGGRARGLASIAAVLVLVDWFGFAQRHAAGGQIVCFGFAVALSFASLNPRRPGRGTQADLWGLAALAALAAIALPLGLMKPAPTWPDTLPSRYRADPGADVSAVWASEQRAAGLTAREPAWGVLRGLPLAGCVVLGTALVADARRRRRIPALRDDFRGMRRRARRASASGKSPAPKFS
jgi:hypothetical protein